jgi:hypothetical protein
MATRGCATSTRRCLFASSMVLASRRQTAALVRYSSADSASPQRGNHPAISELGNRMLILSGASRAGRYFHAPWRCWLVLILLAGTFVRAWHFRTSTPVLILLAARTEAAKIGGVGLQIIRAWVLRCLHWNSLSGSFGMPNAGPTAAG